MYISKFSARPPPLTEPDGNAVRIMPTVKMMGTASYNTVENSSVAFPSEPVKGKAPQSGVAGCCLRLRIRKQPGLRRYASFSGGGFYPGLFFLNTPYSLFSDL